MSNCIDIRNGVVTFHKSILNIPALKKLLDSVRDLKEAPKDNQGYFAWWFLSQNTVIQGDYAFIHFGAGRGSHSYRDFLGTLIHLKSFILRRKTHVFKYTDEQDGHQKVLTWKIDFSNPESTP